MAKYVVHMTTTASMSIEVEVDDNLDEPEAREDAIEEAFQEAPADVCAQCGGWGQSWSMELNEWDLAKNIDGTEMQPERQG
jgi:hypothetical protein